MTGRDAPAPKSPPEPKQAAAATSTASVFVDFAQLFEVLPHAYLIVQADVNFTIVAVNGRYLAATGTRRDQLIGHELFEVFPDNPQDASGSGARDLRASLERVLRDRVADVMGVQKYDIPLRDGTNGFQVKYWSPVNTPFIEPDGSVSLVIHHVEDVTEFVLQREDARRDRLNGTDKIEEPAERIQAEVLRRASDLKEANRQIKAREAQLTTLNAQLEELDRLKTEFFSNVSHEFRTPLTVIIGPLEGLLREPPGVLPMRTRASLEMMYRNALRLLKLVNTLLEFSRIEARAITSHCQPTDLALFTKGIASTFQSLCEQAHLELRIECAQLPDLVLIDREMWEKILLNLLSNAFKFTFAGRIEVQLLSSAEQIELRVRDTGTGIRQEDLPRMFERFHRIRGARGRTYEGTGIGLALVKELAGVLGGTVSVESTEGQGSCFTVRVPLTRAGHDESVNTRTSMPYGTFVREGSLARGFIEEARRWLPDATEDAQNAGSTTSSGPRILIADDNADMRGYVCRLFEEAGFRVKTAPDGTTALSICQAHSVDVVLADVMMPNMNGLELLQHLRADSNTRDLSVILMTARATAEFRVEGMRSGADDYITKPFHASELIARTDAVLHRAAERRRAEAQLRQAAAVFTGTNEGVIITDAQRRILAVNSAFTRITGFSADEVIGKNPNLQKSGRHDPAFYEDLWRTLRANGYWQGELWNRRKSGETYPVWENISAVRDASGQVVNYVAVFSDIGSIKVAEERMTHLAHHDPLTGLPNRLLLTARLEQSLARATRHSKRMGLLLLDLDRFKLINDTLGHTAGDLLLQQVAARLTRCVRAEDTVARLGGDEFAIVLDELAHAPDAAIVAEKILAQLSAPIVIEGRQLVTSASIGISVYPDHASSSESLLRAADVAMYRAKRKGRHGMDLYTAGLTDDGEGHLELELPPALANGELQLYYQPQLELATGRIIGLEALLRWTHASYRVVPPTRIIRIAEDSGFIETLTRWIITEAARQAIAWNTSDAAPLRVSVNLSGRQLTPDHIISTVQEILTQASPGGTCALLEVEVDENVVSQVDCCAEILRELRTLGVGIAIDGFGTGHLSLGRLKSLSIDALKIDGTFTRNIAKDGGDIAAAIIALGHKLGLKIIAKGVETEEQLEFLREQECDAAQGFLISPPLSAAEVTAFLEQRGALDRHPG